MFFKPSKPESCHSAPTLAGGTTTSTITELGYAGRRISPVFEPTYVDSHPTQGPFASHETSSFLRTRLWI